MIARLAALMLAFFALAAPAHADDISAAARSVVRVVVVRFQNGQVSDFGHGSGFAVAPNRIVTNAHVVELAQQDPANTFIGVVPSQGSQSYRAHIVAIDTRRDLALIEMDQGTLSTIPIYSGPLEDGAPVVALGYPGNVDMATASSIQDYITPLPPARTNGNFSNTRTISGNTVLLHTANIARGNSGGPLVDPCGRVLGVNAMITRTQEGDATFGFAIAASELTGFLQDAGQTVRSISSPCVSMQQRLREDQERQAEAERTQMAQQEVQGRQQQHAYEQRLAQLGDERETKLGLAAVLLVLSVVGFGGAAVLLIKNQNRYAIGAGMVGAVLLIGAGWVFLSRPSREDINDTAEGGNQAAAQQQQSRFIGHDMCHLVPERSRVTVSSTEDIPLDWSANGCVNGRTQYAQNGDTWSRVLVPNQDATVAVLEFHPDTGEYIVSRYLLDDQTMGRLRSQRQTVTQNSCTSDDLARTNLANQLRDIRQLLPALPNERLVYDCAPAPAGAAPGATPAASAAAPAVHAPVSRPAPRRTAPAPPTAGK